MEFSQFAQAISPVISKFVESLHPHDFITPLAKKVLSTLNAGQGEMPAVVLVMTHDVLTDHRRRLADLEHDATAVDSALATVVEVAHARGIKLHESGFDDPENIRDVADDVLERAKKYAFTPDEVTVRDLVVESSNLLNVALSEYGINSVSELVMQQVADGLVPSPG